jgi:hypothetical protein
MLLLGFLLVIAASLTIWAALTLNDRAGPASLPAEIEEPSVPLREAVLRPSNDEVRGARARVTPSTSGSDDAFERFLRSDRKRDDADF